MFIGLKGKVFGGWRNRNVDKEALILARRDLYENKELKKSYRVVFIIYYGI